MPEAWYKFALQEIDESKRPMMAFERVFIKSIKARIETGSLTDKQEKVLLNIHKRMTEIQRTKR